MEHYRDLQRSAVAEDGSDLAVRHLDLALGIAETFARRATVNAVDNADYLRSEPPRREGVDQRPPASADAGRIKTFLSEIQPKQRRVLALQKWRLKRVVEYVDDHLSAKVTLSDLAAVAGLSRMHFASQFRMATGFRPHEFVLRWRIGRAEELLKDTTMSIVEIALAVGFQTQAHLTTVFKRFAGCTPGRWRTIKQMPIAAPSRKDRRAEFVGAVAD